MLFSRTSPTPSERIEALEMDRSRFEKVLEKALMSTPLDSRAFRAGVILNPLRGLKVEENLDQKYQCLSPVKPTDTNGKILCITLNFITLLFKIEFII